MPEPIELKSITREEKEPFEQMALLHFQELNPRFEPLEEWRSHYFATIQSKPSFSLCWILSDLERVGFVLFGIEEHRFLPWRIGMIYELFLLPTWRRRGIGETVGRQVIQRLRSEGVRRVQLEVMEGNHKAVVLWAKMGFKKVSERYALGLEV